MPQMETEEIPDSVYGRDYLAKQNLEFYKKSPEGEAVTA
jgi:hypothetical protein